MPARKPRNADGAAPAAERPAKSRARGRARDGAAPDDEMQTLAEFLGARETVEREPNDLKTQTRSFPLAIGVVQRLRATADGITHRVYETPLQDEVPDSISGLLTEFIIAGCTYYEDLLNNGQEFPRVRRLAPGPGRSGAQRGAAIRSRQAADRRAAANQGASD